jgi:hypothetical protein
MIFLNKEHLYPGFSRNDYTLSRHCKARGNLLVTSIIVQNKDFKFQGDCHENPLDDLSKQGASLSWGFRGNDGSESVLRFR